MKNELLGTVETATPDGLTVRLDGDADDTRRTTFDPQRYASFDYGYAVTIHKSQRATVDRAYILASRRMDELLTYVAMTRHRDQLRMYLNDQDRPKWMEHDRDHGVRQQSQARSQVQGPSR